MEYLPVDETKTIGDSGLLDVVIVEIAAVDFLGVLGWNVDSSSSGGVTERTYSSIM